MPMIFILKSGNYDFMLTLQNWKIFQIQPFLLFTQSLLRNWRSGGRSIQIKECVSWNLKGNANLFCQQKSHPCCSSHVHPNVIFTINVDKKSFVAVVLPYKCVSCVDFLSSRKCVMHFKRVPCRHKQHKKLQIVKSIIKCREETAQAFSFLIVINALIICHMRNQWRHKYYLV